MKTEDKIRHTEIFFSIFQNGEYLTKNSAMLVQTQQSYNRTITPMSTIIRTMEFRKKIVFLIRELIEQGQGLRESVFEVSAGYIVGRRTEITVCVSEQDTFEFNFNAVAGV